MFPKNDSRGQRGMRPVSFETLRSCFPLSETQSQKFERVRDWVNNLKTGLETARAQQEDPKVVTSTSEKTNSTSQPWDDCSLSTVSSASNSILNMGSSMKGDFGSTPTENEQTTDDLDTEPQCELQEEAEPKAARKPFDFYSFAGYARTKPYGRPGLENQLGNSSEPKLSSGIERDVLDHDFSQYEPTKWYSGNHAFESDFINAPLDRLDNVAVAATASGGSSLKRKLQGDEALSDAEKKLRRSHRFAADLEQPQAVKLTADKVNGNQPKLAVKKPCFSNRVEPSAQVPQKKPLNSEDEKLGKRRPIVIDGSNVAMEYTNGAAMDCKGIQACVNHFLKLDHDDITVVVPEKYMLRSCKRVINQDILFNLKKEGRLLTCWSRQVGNGKYVNCYDDRMILDFATKRGAIIVSNDKYRDLFRDEPKWRDAIRKRVLPYRFMPGQPDDMMLPQDPFGRFGPTLEEFLRFT